MPPETIASPAPPASTEAPHPAAPRRPLQAVRRPHELLEPEAEDPHYDFRSFIRLDSFGERRAARRRLKLLKVVDPVVQAMVGPDEVVYCVTRGLRLSVLEQFFVGSITYYYNLTAFVFTSQRILLVHLKSTRRRGTYLGAIDYRDVRRVTSSLLGSLAISLRNGKALRFGQIPRRDRRFIRDFLGGVIDGSAPVERKAAGVRHLCAGCQEEVHGFPDSCPACGLGFKSPRRAGWLSLLMPGLGDLYLGSKFLGAIEVCFMLFLWYGFVFAPYADETGALHQPTGAEIGISALVLFLLLHPADALKSRYLGRKGLIPRQPVKFPGE